MQSKLAKWYLSQDRLPYWYLLFADCLTIILAGFFAFIINHRPHLSQLPTLLLTLTAYLPFYVVGIYVFHTYRDAVRRIEVRGLLRVGGAIAFGAISVVILRVFFHSDLIGSTIRLRDLAFQSALAFVLMTGMRMLVKLAYEDYMRHNRPNIYGLSNNDLLGIELSALLPRKEIKINMAAVQEKMQNKRILITGAGGSIGSELVRLVAALHPQQLLLLDIAETPLHDVRLMLSREYPQVACQTVVCNICHPNRLSQLFDSFKPEIVFHAAAYKHVPMMEDNPTESILNNVDGTVKLANLSIEYGVKTFVMVSTDKAVNPTNVMGCSKRICEIYCQSLNNDKRNIHGCQFITTRFGNVLGSNGSVVPTFRQQIRNGGPVYVTHPDIERYFMLIPEACKLVLQAATIGEGGKIYVFDMGQPVKIVDLARRMIELSGKSNIQIAYSGLRPGEKLYEELLNDAERVEPTPYERISIARVREYVFDEVQTAIQELINTALSYDAKRTVTLMKGLVPEYVSANELYRDLTTSH